jgi:ABC-type cobalamin/Fe3+-siderophores transport system ATPase subunit
MTGDIKQKIETLSEKLQQFLDSVVELSNYQWNDESARIYCENKGIAVSDYMVNQLSQKPNILSDLNNFNYEELLNKLRSFKDYSDKLLLNNKWDDFNEAYKTHTITSIEKILQQIADFNNSVQNYNNMASLLNNVCSQLKNINNNLNPNLNELFEHFKYGYKNYVIFGKNGSGKTTLLNEISSEVLKDNSIVIPANREISFDDSSIIYTSTQELNQILSLHSNNYPLVYLTSKIDSNITLPETRTKFYNIFSGLGLDRIITSSEYKLELSTNNGNKYSIENGSDGERSIAYLIMATLLAPQNSFVFIDEPERHLNGALMRNLFDKLEDERPDLRFIYLTHITDFVESRKNVELIYLEKTDVYRTWNFKKLDDYSDISLDVILTIGGSKKDIIFCEGTRASIDCKILECLYPEYEIKPVESCEQVILNTKGINGKENIFRRHAFGLIDNDYRAEAELEGLKKDNIFAIGYNEWENLLINSNIIEKVNESFLKKNLSETKNNIISFIKNSKSKSVILRDFLNKRYPKIISADKLRYDSELESQIDNLNRKNKETIIKDVESLSDNIDRCNDYDELVSLVSAKMLLNKIAQDLGFNKNDDYIEMVVKLLKQDVAFNELLKSKLTFDFSKNNVTNTNLTTD